LKLSGVTSDYFSEHKIRVIKNHEKKDTINFLDFGCGDGNSSQHFTNYFPNSIYNGIDISSESINVANSKSIKNTNFQTFDGISIPFQDNSFDVIFTACVFHHIDFKLHENLFNEIYRVLKPSGKFYIFEHNPWNPVTRHMVNTCPFDEDAVLLNPNYTKKALNKIFNNSITNYILFFPRHKLFSPFIKLEGLLSKIPLGGQYYTFAQK
ncbi:MAG: class I SAM-dependent methyltransferase, partial [Crocinitomicaceae bacterium]